MSNSSLFYEMLLHLNTYYFILFGVAELSMLVFKIINLPYTTGTLLSEFLILIFLFWTEAFRIFMGHKGNLTEKSYSIIISIVLTLTAILGVLYFLIWQTYVLWLELILCGIELTLQGLELSLAILCLSKFCRADTY